MKVRRANWDNRSILVSINNGKIVELKVIDMRGRPMTLFGMFEAMDEETKKRALEDADSDFCILRESNGGC